jgi:aspartyl-tRNA(Asn)/glutamyl-tRNA(Gln) amidotransferase subunit B
MSTNPFEAVIGIEVHVQLATKSKIFCACPTSFGAGDNENTCPICTGMPGALPVLNKTAVEYAVKTGLALNCEIPLMSEFSRKNYFYPDLPKGYQISQFDKPVCGKGFLDIKLESGEKKRIGITRAHLEEDAGKSSHHGDYSLINLNRACVPLLEIVSEPDLRTPHEAAQYVRAIRDIVRSLGVCDGNLEEGSLRADCNISVRPVGQEKLGTKVELKNLNSFRFIEKALAYEIDRQIDLHLNAEKDKIIQETRLYDADKNRTYTMRTKESAEDYRYFPEPDLLACHVDPKFVEELKASLPELPSQKAERFMREYSLSEHDAEFMVTDMDMAAYFESLAVKSKNPKAATSWVMVEIIKMLKDEKLEFSEVKTSVSSMAELIQLVDSDKISGKTAKSVFEEMWNTGKSPEVIVEEKGLVQVSDESAIEKFIEEILENNQKQVEEYRSGKQKVYGFFVGQVMKASKGKANPEILNKILKENLNS